MSKRMKLFVLCSVLLNVLLGGIVIGHLSHRWRGDSREQQIVNMLEKSSLPAEKKALVKQRITALYEESEATREEARKAREEAMRILVTEPFNGEAYQLQVDAMQDMWGQRRQRTTEVIKELAPQLTPEERKELAGMLKRPGSRCGGK